MNYRSTIEIGERTLNVIDELLCGTGNENITRVPNEAHFADGCMALIDVVREKTDVCGHIEATLYDPDSNEVSKLKTRGAILGTWQFKYGSNAYTVRIDAAKAKPFPLKKSACPHPVH